MRFIVVSEILKPILVVSMPVSYLRAVAVVAREGGVSSFPPWLGNMISYESVSVLLALGSNLVILSDEIFWSGDYHEV